MTQELLDRESNDAERVVIAWLHDPAKPSVNVRRPGDPLPMTVVHALPGVESVEESTTDVVVSVHTLCDKRLGEDAASLEKNKTHRRMTLLARYLEDVDLGDGRMASVDYVKVFTTQHIEKYVDERIIHYVGRYTLGFSYDEVVDVP